MPAASSTTSLPGYQIPDDEKIKRSSFDWHALFTRRHLLAGFWMAAASAFSLISPWCLVRAVDAGIALNDSRSLICWIAAAALAQILSGVFRYIGKCRIAYLGLEREKSRLSMLFSKLMNSDLRALPEVAQGEAMGQIIFAASSERQFVETFWVQCVSLCVILAGTSGALLMLSWQLALLSFLLFPAAAVLWIWMRKKIGPAVRAEYECREKLYHSLIDMLRAMVPIRALHQNERFTTRFDDDCRRASDAGYGLEKKTNVQDIYFDVLQAGVLVAVFGAGGYAVMHSSVTIGALLGFQVYLMKVFSAFRSGTGIFGAYQQFREGRARACDIENLPVAPDVQHERAQNPEVLRLDHVSFSFGDRAIWQDKSLVIRRGEFQALLMPSGSGKTTLARCILGLYPISSGSIAAPEKHKIGFVPQDNVLFDGSIRENVSLMCESLSDETFEKVVYTSCIEELVSRLGETSIGELGMRLSGGEQRRVMLARALAADPELLMIDQMSSELEPELCERIFTRIREQYPEVGVFYLGHRMPETGEK